jgi:peptidoglycan hydrolase CwlO-like protein
VDIEDTVKDLREQIRVKDIEIQSLRESRDMFQNENAELKRTVKSLQAKLKKAEG